MATHTDKAFEADLNEIRTKILTMGARIEGQISASMYAVTHRDSTLAEKVKDDDLEVNRLEVEIDELCRRTLALRHPAANDLRFITTALKIVTDLERMGDAAVNIAERAIDLNHSTPLQVANGLPRLATLAQDAVRTALNAFVTGNAVAAEEVLGHDEQIDALFVEIFNQMLAMMIENSDTIRRATSLLSVSKHLERIGDHAMNVAEMVIYMVRGTDIRHPRSRSLPRAPQKL